MNLADTIDVEVRCPVERIENPRRLPAHAAELVAQECFLLGERCRKGSIFVSEREQEHGAVVAHGEPRDLAADARVHHVDKLIAQRVAPDFEGRNLEAEVFLELRLVAVDQLADAGVRAVAADDQIEVASGARGKANIDAGAGLLETDDAVAEQGFDFAVEGVVDAGGQIAARNAEELALGHFEEGLGGKRGGSSAAIIDDADFADDVAVRANAGQHAHAVGDLEAGAPEIDDIAARAQARRGFDQGGRKSVASQPPGECRTCHAGAGDEDAHAGYRVSLLEQGGSREGAGREQGSSTQKIAVRCNIDRSTI